MKSRVSIQKRIEGDQKLLLEQFRKTPIVETSCQKVGIGRSSYYRWRAENKDFAQAADEALNEGVKLINDYAENQLLSLIKNGNSAGIFYWLNHRHPAYASKLEIIGKIKHEEQLTPEQEALITKALKLASVLPDSLPKPKEGQK
jgi:hypothetical protein